MIASDSDIELVCGVLEGNLQEGRLVEEGEGKKGSVQHVTRFRCFFLCSLLPCAQRLDHSFHSVCVVLSVESETRGLAVRLMK